MKKCPICKTLNTNIFFKKKLNYYLCRECKTIFVSKLPKFEEIKKFYSYKFNYKPDIIKLKKNFFLYKKVYENLKKINSKGKTLLDIGSGYGLFLKIAKKYKIHPTALEPSNKFLPYLKKNKEIKIINKTFEEFYKQNKTSSKLKFDYITMFHVIEHCKNPKKWLIMAEKLLNKNGVLYIETPNLDSFLFYYEKTNFTFLIPFEHLWIFSIISFRHIINELKTLKIKKVFTYSHPEHFVGILKIIFKRLNHSKIQEKNNLKLRILKSKNKLSLIKKIKIILIDKIFASIFTPFLNINNHGSILGLYIVKK